MASMCGKQLDTIGYNRPTSLRVGTCGKYEAMVGMINDNLATADLHKSGFDRISTWAWGLGAHHGTFYGGQNSPCWPNVAMIGSNSPRGMTKKENWEKADVACCRQKNLSPH